MAALYACHLLESTRVMLWVATLAHVPALRAALHGWLPTRLCRGRPADVYALGGCLYSFVFGRIPFK